LLLFWIDCLICYFATGHLPMMPPWLFSNDAAIVLSDTNTPVLLTTPWCQYCCRFLSLPLPLPPVDCCFCLWFTAVVVAVLFIYLLLRLLPVMLPLLGCQHIFHAP